MSLLLPSFYRLPSEAQRGQTAFPKVTRLRGYPPGCCVTSHLLGSHIKFFLLPSCLPSLSVSPKGSLWPPISSKSAPLVPLPTVLLTLAVPGFQPLLVCRLPPGFLLPGPSLELLDSDTLLTPTGTQSGTTDPIFNDSLPGGLAPPVQNLGGIPSSLLFLCTVSSNSRAKSLSFQSPPAT